MKNCICEECDCSLYTWNDICLPCVRNEHDILTPDEKYAQIVEELELQGIIQ